MDLAHIVHWDLDIKTDTLIFNDPFYSFLGTTAAREGGYRMKREEFVKHFIHPDDQDRHAAAVIQSLAGKDAESIVDLEHRIIRRDGLVRHVIARIKILKDDSGYPARIYGANQDITERKMIEEEREKLIVELKEAISQVKTLSGLLPICASCKKIRDKKGTWEHLESYIRDHSGADFSHSICPECAAKLYPEYMED